MNVVVKPCASVDVLSTFYLRCTALTCKLVQLTQIHSLLSADTLGRTCRICVVFMMITYQKAVTTECVLVYDVIEYIVG